MLEKRQITRTKPCHVFAGQRWTFVHNGKATDYVVRSAEFEKDPGEQAGQNYAFLTNPTTGKDAMVSLDWLWQTPRVGRPHWVRVEEMVEAV